jgi:hypothetical protein
MKNFNHAISDSFIEKLKAEAGKDSWWNHVLSDPGLFIALRGAYLNVYWHGQSLFKVEPSESGLKVSTHEKFLIDPALASQVQLTDGTFETANLIDKAFIRRYADKATLKKMKQAARYFSGAEKQGCHEIAIRNPCVIDCEIAFPGVAQTDGKRHGRADLASIEKVGKEIQLVFWEAKDYSNHELRSDERLENKKPLVLCQLQRYRDFLAHNREAVVNSYKNVAKNLLSLQSMGSVRRLSPLITEVATGNTCLTLGENPNIRLVIFGFDQAQRDHESWQYHLQRLEAGDFPIKPVGNAKQIKL